MIWFLTCCSYPWVHSTIPMVPCHSTFLTHKSFSHLFLLEQIWSPETPTVTNAGNKTVNLFLRLLTFAFPDPTSQIPFSVFIHRGHPSSIFQEGTGLLCALTRADVNLISMWMAQYPSLS